jgi:hypothetical protein
MIRDKEKNATSPMRREREKGNREQCASHRGGLWRVIAVRPALSQAADSIMPRRAITPRRQGSSVGFGL